MRGPCIGSKESNSDVMADLSHGDLAVSRVCGEEKENSTTVRPTLDEPIVSKDDGV